MDAAEVSRGVYWSRVCAEPPSGCPGAEDVSVGPAHGGVFHAWLLWHRAGVCRRALSAGLLR